MAGEKSKEERILDQWDYSRVWYHGSPFELERLSVGSTITQDRDIARVFSHKPPLVSLSTDESGSLSIKHSGERPGFLYRIVDEIGSEDVYPHPKTSMEPGQEWLIRRELRIELIEPTVAYEHERFTDEELAELRRRIDARTEIERTHSRIRVGQAPSGDQHRGHRRIDVLDLSHELPGPLLLLTYRTRCERRTKPLRNATDE